MRIIKATRLVLLPALLLLVATGGLSQTESDSQLRVIPSRLKLQSEGVRFAGREIEEGIFADGPKLVYEGFAYYSTLDERGGLVVEDLKSRARVLYEPTELALSAGWLKGRGSAKEGDILRNHLRGYARSLDTIWMGTDGFGILAFDTNRKVWARYDSEAQARPGQTMSSIFYADEDYVFAGGYNVYSQKQKRWIKVDGIPTRYVRHFGYADIYVQSPWSLLQYAKEKYLPLSEPSKVYGLWWPDKVTLRDDGEAYTFEFGHDESLTEFTIEKWQLDWAFSQATLNQSTEQSSK